MTKSHAFPFLSKMLKFSFFVELCKIIRKWNDVSRAVSTNSCFKTKLITIESKMIYYPVSLASHQVFSTLSDLPPNIFIRVNKYKTHSVMV